MRNKGAKSVCSHRQNILRTIWLAFLAGNVSGNINRLLRNIARTEKSRTFSLTGESYFSIKLEIISLYLHFCQFDLYLLGHYEQLVDKTKQNKRLERDTISLGAITFRNHFLS